MLGTAAVNAGQPELVSMDEVPDDAWIATAAAIGAPAGTTEWQMLGVDYVKAVGQLLETGKWTTLTGRVIGADEDLRADLSPPNIKDADWIFAATMRDDPIVRAGVESDLTPTPGLGGEAASIKIFADAMTARLPNDPVINRGRSYPATFLTTMPPPLACPLARHSWSAIMEPRCRARWTWSSPILPMSHVPTLPGWSRKCGLSIRDAHSTADRTGSMPIGQ